jgi:hypothetical protein
MRITKGGGIVKNTDKPVDDSGDAATVADWLGCTTRQVRRGGFVVRAGRGLYDLKGTVTTVVGHLHGLAVGQRTEGADVSNPV